MASWGLVIVLLIVTGFFAWRDPRTLRTGVLLVATLSLAGIALLGEILGRESDPDDLTGAFILLGIIAVAMISVVILGVFLVVNGITMVRNEGRSLAHLLSFFLGCAILGYVGLAILSIIVSSEEIAVTILLLGFPIAYLSFVFAAFVIYAWVYGMAMRLFGSPVNAVIVLGAGLRGERVTPLLASRLDRGMQVFRRSQARGRAPLLVTSGGQGADEVVSEAQAMATYLIEHGIPETAIALENRSRTTHENLLFSRNLLAEQGVPGPFAVVTNNFHAFRAALLMRGVGLPGYTIGSPTARYFWPSATIREFLAILRDHPWLNGLAVGTLSLPVVGFLIAMIVG